MIAVVGESLVDLVADADGRTFHALPGGAPMNVAVTIARLGGTVRFLGRTSADVFGERLRAHLAGEGVSLAGAPVGEEPTALAVVTLDPSGHPSYRFLWDGTADRLLALADLPGSLAGDEALVVGGVSTVLEPVATTVEALVARERAGRIIVFDPNVRPQFVEDPAAFRRRVDRLVGLADVVKVSDEDLAWLSDEDPLSDRGALGGAATGRWWSSRAAPADRWRSRGAPVPRSPARPCRSSTPSAPATPSSAPPSRGSPTPAGSTVPRWSGSTPTRPPSCSGSPPTSPR